VKIDISERLAHEHLVQDDKLNASDKSTPEEEFADMTQKLNYIISRFAFHETRTQANIVLVKQIRTYMANLLDKVVLIDKDGDPTPPASEVQWSSLSAKALLASADRLNARLNHLESEQRALLLEISCNAKIASSQLQIVSFRAVLSLLP
jgi:hypothetical protein